MARSRSSAATAYTETGLVTANGDAITLNSMTGQTSPGAQASASVGTYSIVPNSVTVSDPSNYNTIVYVNGTLRSIKATLTITAESVSKNYRATLLATSFTYSILVNGQPATSLLNATATPSPA